MQLIKSPWNSIAENILFNAACGEIADIREQVKSGESELWRVEQNELTAGYVVTRVEVRDASTTFVIVAGAGHYGREVMTFFCELADVNSWNMRIHSIRNGMFRYLKQFSFRQAETIYKRTPHNG